MSNYLRSIDRYLESSDLNNLNVDAFSRLRISNPQTLFDAKMNTANRNIFWDDQETSGSGTSSIYSSTRSSYLMSVSDATAGTRVRQSKQRFNYQAGKSQFSAATFVGGAEVAGITRRVGLFDNNNGLFLQQDSTGLSVVVRSNTTGTPIDNIIPQHLWNIEELHASSSSPYVLDFTKAQIFFIDFESLQVGTVRFGFFIKGKPIYVHAQHHANIIDSAYFQTPNLPVRYEISNDGTGPAATLESICSTVISEGGSQDTGITRYISTGGTELNASTADTTYALLGMKLKTVNTDCVVKLQKLSVISETNDDFEWTLLLNPTVAGTFTYSGLADSCIDYAAGATANTVTGGIALDGGFAKSSESITNLVNNLYYLGSTIDNIADSLVLAIRPLSNNALLQGSITFKELA